MHSHDVVNIPKTTPFVKSLLGEHYCVGNDLDQSTSRQFQQISEMVRRNSYLSGKVRIDKKRLEFLPTGSTIVALATDSRGNAGSNHLSCSHTESWGIVYEAGIRAFEELTPPRRRTLPRQQTPS